MRLYKYPFLSSLAETGLSVNPELIQKAEERIEQDFTAAYPYVPEVSGDDKKTVASFALAKLIVSQMQKPMWNRFSVNESKRTRAYIDRENDDSVLETLSHSLGIRSSKLQGDSYSVELIDYLKFSPREREYLLSAQELGNGKVILKESSFKRLIESRIRAKVFSSLEEVFRASLDDQKGIARFVQIAKRLEQKHAPKTKLYSSKDERDYPPCIVSLLAKLAASENLTHNARVYLTVYLLKVGKSIEQVVELYTTSPDYNEKMTQYQVGYIAKKGYSVFNCSNVMTMGLCVAECGTKNPMQFRPRQRSSQGPSAPMAQNPEEKPKEVLEID